MSKYALEEQLIIEVEAYPILYNLRHPDRKIKANVDKVWTKIAAVINEDQDFVKKKWKNFKDTFRQKCREKLQPSGSQGGRKKEWVFYRRLCFLIPFIEIIGTESNYSHSSASNTPGRPGSDSTVCASQSENLGEQAVEVEEQSQQIDFVISSAQKRRQEQKDREQGVKDRG
ncbi:hypothetical protein Bhyg_07912 [Pseudolycoriella hygida]|uniref:MADF domain-containing protein n=1 Tax=Pseudolycoriella hygida TaxID=35572 RepID=A0A9Q0N4I7_9DIPT|nr:hypothetical protein Bhyg_07912 [Pseudolycoriella hygida]